MGDYNKLIVAGTVKAKREELEEKVKELGLYDSAYQSQEVVISIEQNTWSMKQDCLNIVLVGQTKWGERQIEFLNWLKPFVVQGSGENDVFAMQFSEYQTTPTLWSLTPAPEER